MVYPPRYALGLLLGAVLACAPSPAAPPGTDAEAPPADGAVGVDGPAGEPCSPADDPDRDGIPNAAEGIGDRDGDGVPNVRDTDSDGDGIADRVESQPRSGSALCVPAPVDSDRDGQPDFLDTDSNNDGIEDRFQAAPSPGQPGSDTPPTGGWSSDPFDTDRDGVADYADDDADGDRINNAVEVPPGGPTDTDGDGIPDYRDTDSDGDTILDRDEGAGDRDVDMIPSFRDDDSDGDTVPDREEAGDADPATRPVECERELDPRTLDLRAPRPDGVPDFHDTDSDNDGLSDREERMAGTQRCNPDSDGDGQLDVAEVAWCARRMRTGCATDRAVTIPETDYYIILPNGGRATRELEFGTTIRVADVFFLSDTTGSMNSVLASVRSSIATPMRGLIDRIRAEIPDTWFGVGHYEDFPRSPHAALSDRVFHPLCQGPPGSAPTMACSMARYGGIVVTPPARAMQVQDAAQAIPRGSGGDGFSTSVEALYQLVAGDGLFDRSSPLPCTDGTGAGGCWVPPARCSEGHFGWACFRQGALPIVVHYSDTQSHWGARNLDPPSTTFNRPTADIRPFPHTHDDLLAAYRRVGARMISLNASASASCESTRLTAHTGTQNPCFDFRVWAEGTGSLSVEGESYVYDIRVGDGEGFIAATVQGIRQLATRTPLDVSTGTENDPANPAGVDATRFIQRRVPSCQVPTPNDRCWTPPPGVAHRAAVTRTDATTFYRVVPGTRVRFTITFANEGVFPGFPDRSALFHAYIHVLADGANRLDTREVYILVPSRPSDPG